MATSITSGLPSINTAQAFPNASTSTTTKKPTASGASVFQMEKDRQEAKAEASVEAKRPIPVDTKAQREALIRAKSGTTETKTLADGTQVEVTPEMIAQFGLGGAQASVAGAQQAQAGEQLQEAGAFEQVTPTEQDLADPLQTDVPIATPALAGLGQVVGERSVLGILRDKGIMKKFLPPIKEGEGQFPIPETPETLREAALRQVSINSFNEGVSNAESFGSAVEAIPLVGGLARKYVNGLIETPSSNADEVIANLNKVKEAASTGQEKVRNGLESPEYGLTRARQMEEKIAELRGRLKLLISTSPILQANTDEVNTMQEAILETEEKVARYKQASSFGFTAELTGTGRVIPTDEQLFYELKGGK